MKDFKYKHIVKRIFKVIFVIAFIFLFLDSVTLTNINAEQQNYIEYLEATINGTVNADNVDTDSTESESEKRYNIGEPVESDGIITTIKNVYYTDDRNTYHDGEQPNHLLVVEYEVVNDSYEYDDSITSSVLELYENDVLVDNYVSDLAHHDMTSVSKGRKVESVTVFPVSDKESNLEIEYSPVGISTPKIIEIDI